MSKIFEYIIFDQAHKSKTNGIVDGILESISNNDLSKGEQLPSVNKFIKKLGVARMTVVKALNILKERGIIVSEDKIGYYVRDIRVKRELKVFLFLTGFHSYHETLYNNIIERINAQDITIDLYFHHGNPKIFKSVLHENIGSYGLYVITGFDDVLVKTALSHIPPKKLLQIIRPPLIEGVPSITQDFYIGLKKSLDVLKGRLLTYKRFILVFPSRKGHPEEIKVAFTEFCSENGIEYQIEKKVTRDLITKGTAFWVIEDCDLISLIKMGEDLQLKLGSELGILSYNETPMKEIIRNGITVVSIDFAMMGQSISRFINHPKQTFEVFAPNVIIRNSL